MKTLTAPESKALYTRLKASLDPEDILLQILFETGARVSEALEAVPKLIPSEVIAMIEPMTDADLVAWDHDADIAENESALRRLSP